MIIIKNRFGEFSIKNENIISFPSGLIGLPNQHRYCLTNLPAGTSLPQQKKIESFKLFHCLDDQSLTFITLSIPLNNDIISLTDIENTTKIFKIDMVSVCILLIVSVNTLDSNERILSVNTKAPLFIDVGQKIGIQYILSNRAYSTKHIIYSY